MRPHWMGPSQENAELEALQTDVMRFIAILGLCLAAIFSLVHSAALEQAQSGSASESPPRPRPGPTRDAGIKSTIPEKPSLPPPYKALEMQPVIATAIQPQPTTQTKPEEIQESTPEISSRSQEAAPLERLTREPAPDAVEPGFTLEFSSGRVLRTLLENGQLRLYAQLRDGFWLADSQGRFMSSNAPPQYYEMQAGTVPGELRNALAAVAGDGSPGWGVTLPAVTVEQITSLTSRVEGGQLVIEADGSVTLDNASH